MTRQLPIIEDPSCHAYYREEGGGLLVGLANRVMYDPKMEKVRA